MSAPDCDAASLDFSAWTAGGVASKLLWHPYLVCSVRGAFEATMSPTS
jgi:hypothetical protein